MRFNLDSDFNFLWCGLFHAHNENWVHESRYCDSYEIFYVIKGTLYIADDKNKYTVSTGEYLVTPPCKNQYGWKNSDCSFYWFHFTTKETTKREHGDFYLCQDKYQHIDVIERYYSMLYLNNGMEKTGGMLISALLVELRNNMFRKQMFLSEIHNRILAYIKFAPAENLKVYIIAAKFNYNEIYLSQRFKKEMGISLKKYLMNEVIHRAMHLLDNTTSNIGQIGEQLGFSDVHNFSHAFKNAVGKSPREYRKNKF